MISVNNYYLKKYIYWKYYSYFRYYQHFNNRTKKIVLPNYCFTSINEKNSVRDLLLINREQSPISIIFSDFLIGAQCPSSKKPRQILDRERIPRFFHKWICRLSPNFLSFHRILYKGQTECSFRKKCSSCTWNHKLLLWHSCMYYKS